MNIVRLRMFETNSSSMHSIVLNKETKKPSENDIKYAYYSFDNYECKDYRNLPNEVYMDLSKEREDTHYCRQDGKVVMNSDDKLYMYLVLGAADIWNTINIEHYAAKEFDVMFEKFVKDLQTRIFDKLNIHLKVTPPVLIKRFREWDDDLDNSYYDLQGLPPIEDSCGVFKEFLDYLKTDDAALYSFIFDTKSFAVLGGDEYDTATELCDILRRGINYNSRMFGYIGDPVTENNE